MQTKGFYDFNWGLKSFFWDKKPLFWGENSGTALLTLF